MDVIGHYDHDIQIDCGRMFMHAAVERDLPGTGWKNPPAMRAESQEMGLVVPLQVWEVPSVKSLGHPRNAAERRSTFIINGSSSEILEFRTKSAPMSSDLGRWAQILRPETMCRACAGCPDEGVWAYAIRGSATARDSSPQSAS